MEEVGVGGGGGGGFDLVISKVLIFSPCHIVTELVQTEPVCDQSLTNVSVRMKTRCCVV